MRKTLLSIIACATLAGCSFSIGNGGGNAGSNSKSPAKPASEITEADAVRLDYMKSKDAAIAKYNNKEITIKGKVFSVSTFEGTSFAGTAVLNFATSFDGDLDHAPYVMCEVDKADYPALKDVKDGDTATVKGMLHVDDVAIKIIGCKNAK